MNIFLMNTFPVNIILCYAYWLCLSFMSAWLIMHAMEYLIKISPRRVKRWLMLFSCWLISSVIIFIGDSFNILTMVPFFLATVMAACQGSIWQRITVGTMYASTILSFNALRDNYLKHPIYAQYYTMHAVSAHTHWMHLLTGGVTVSWLFSLLLYTGIRKFAPDKDYTLSDSLWRLLFLLTMPPFGITLCVTTLPSQNVAFGQSLLPEYLALLSISLLAFVSLLWCITVLAKQQKLERQNMFMEINRKYYDAMEQQHFEVRRLKHDLTNHIQLLSALPENQQASYIKNLADLTDNMQPLSYCGDATVNAVLSVKKSAMDRAGIRMETSIDIPSVLPFHKTDICALYANALDNAIESCMKLEETRRVVTVKSKAQKGLFCLEISNPLPNTSEKTAGWAKHKDGKPGCILPTSKEDKRNHGFGMRSIGEIVDRYNGRMELNIVDGEFDLFLYIPLEYT